MTFYLRLLILRPKLSKCLENSKILCKYTYVYPKYALYSYYKNKKISIEV